MKPDIFILSSPRSGSTLTRLTLDKITSLITLPETHFWVFKKEHSRFSFPNDVAVIAEKWVNYHSIKSFPVDLPALKERIIKEAKCWKDLLEITIASYVNWKTDNLNDGAKLICEKSPPHIFFQKEILEDYPESRFIFLIRDPRDVVASLKTCSWSTSNPYINAKVWKNGVRTFAKFAKKGLVVRYEDLVTDPDKTLGDICNFLGVKFEPEILNLETLDVVEQKHVTSAKSLKPVTNSYVGTYKNILSGPDREQEVVEFVCKKEMRQFGYKLEKFEKMNLALRVKMLSYRLDLFLRRIIN